MKKSDLDKMEKPLDMALSLFGGLFPWMAFQAFLQMVGSILTLINVDSPNVDHPQDAGALVLAVVVYEAVALAVSATITLRILVGLHYTTWKDIRKATGHILLGFSTMYIALVLVAVVAQFPAESVTFVALAVLDVLAWGIYFVFSWGMKQFRTRTVK